MTLDANGCLLVSGRQLLGCQSWLMLLIDELIKHEQVSRVAEPEIS